MCAALIGRLDQSADPFIATTIVSFEEQMRGWTAAIHGERSVHRQVAYYDRLGRMVEFFKRWTIVPFDSLAADQFMSLKESRVRIGSQDLKIASIALIHDALLLSANLRDFRKVPGLKVESWL